MARPPKPLDIKRDHSFKTYVNKKTYNKLEEYRKMMSYPSISYAASVLIENSLQKSQKI